MEKLIDSKTLAEKLGISRNYVYQMALRKELPCVRLSKKVIRFRESDVETWLSEKHHGKEAKVSAVRFA